MNQSLLAELCQTSNSTDLSIMWTVIMEREVNRDFDIARNLLAVSIELQESLNTKKDIINEAKINKNTKMMKSAAFFREQQD
ncbi:hypothetical protein Tco_0321004 [Tanacetum coccineum]